MNLNVEFDKFYDLPIENRRGHHASLSGAGADHGVVVAAAVSGSGNNFESFGAAHRHLAHRASAEWLRGGHKLSRRLTLVSTGLGSTGLGSTGLLSGLLSGLRTLSFSLLAAALLGQKLISFHQAHADASSVSPDGSFGTLAFGRKLHHAVAIP